MGAGRIIALANGQKAVSSSCLVETFDVSDALQRVGLSKTTSTTIQTRVHYGDMAHLFEEKWA